MTTFLDGPAGGVELGLRRAPIMLRVTRGRNGNWDALDQPDDEPRRNERIFVYHLVGQTTSVHICARGKGGKALRGTWTSGVYRHLTEHVADEHLRTTAAWAKWCDANESRLRALIASQPEAAR